MTTDCTPMPSGMIYDKTFDIGKVTFGLAKYNTSVPADLTHDSCFGITQWALVFGKYVLSVAW